MTQDGEGAPLDKVRHLKYWSRCLRSLLPHHYTSSDSNRMALAYFILSAIDLLLPQTSSPNSEPEPQPPQQFLLTHSDRLRFREWTLSCQHPGGGFCGSPSMTSPPGQTEEGDNEAGANIAATAFALILLAILSQSPHDAAGAFLGVDRARTLRWLRKLQRPDGSFGEVLGRVEGQGMVIGGGRDMRYCYFAAVIRWILRGDVKEGDAGWVEDIDVEGLRGYIAQSRTYDGGIAESQSHEPHSGYGYCALGALALLDRREGQTGRIDKGQVEDVAGLVSWLVGRMFVYVEPTEEQEDEDNFAFLPEGGHVGDDPIVGFNGRCNKVADTCYCWWVSGALALLASLEDGGSNNVDLLVPRAAARKFLMEKTQHYIGGFAKHPGGPPDLYHSYLGLAALATMGEPGLKEFDAALAVSRETVEKLVAAREGLLAAGRGDDGMKLGSALRDLGVEIRGERPPWLGVKTGS